MGAAGRLSTSIDMAATMFATVNGIRAGFYTAGPKNAQPEIYPAGKSITGDLGRLKVYADYWAPGSNYGTIKLTNLKVQGYQAPAANFVDIRKASSPSKVLPGGTIDYRVTVQVGSPKSNVVVQDSFLNGVSLVAGTALLDGLPITPILIAQHQNRQVYQFQLGDLPAGSYTLTFRGQVDPDKQCRGQKVTNDTSLYINGKFADTSKSDTPLRCP